VVLVGIAGPALQEYLQDTGYFPVVLGLFVCLPWLALFGRWVFGRRGV
jgi:hypothetical protein